MPTTVPTTGTPSAAPWRVARAVVVAAAVTPVVVVAHLLTRGQAPGPVGLAAVGVLVGLATLAVPGSGRSVTLRLTAAVVVAQVAGHAVLAALSPGGAGAGCLPAVGRGAEAGLHLAMLRADAACSTGGYAAGPTLTALLGAVVTAVALVAGQVLVAALTARLLVAGEALVAAVRDLVRAVLPALPRRTVAVPPVPRRARPRPQDRAPLPAPVAPRPISRRGPPAPVGA